MAKQISRTAIGAFVISAIALIVIAVIVFGSGSFFQDSQKYVLFFENSVKGLNVGSSVVWRGVKVGSVTDVILLVDPESLTIYTPVILEIKAERIQLKGGGPKGKDPYEGMKKMIERGLRARLTMESLVTGQLMVDLDFYPDKPARLVGSEYPYPEIPTIPTTLDEIAETIDELPIKEIFDKLEAAADNVAKVLGSPELTEIVRFTKKTMEKTNKLVDDVNKLVNDVGKQVEPLSVSMTTAARDAQKLIQNIESQVNPMASKVQEAIDATKSAVEQAERTLQGIEDLKAEGSVTNYKVTKALEELTRAARAVRVLSDYLQQYPDAPLRGKGLPGGQ